MRELTDHLYCVPSERLILFSVCSFSYELALEALDYLYEWNLLKDGKLKNNTLTLNTFLVDTISKAKQEVENYARSKNMKLFYFNIETEFGSLTQYMDDSDSFSKKIKRYVKKYLCGGKVIPIITEKLTFNCFEFDGMKCLKLTGEEIEIILKKLNRFKKSFSFC